MHTYTKLWHDLVTSSLWATGELATKVVWITMLAMKDREHVVSASIPGLARTAGVTIPECEQAITTFLSPDPYSRTKEFDGRRILEVEGGWLILNGEKFQSRIAGEERREYLAEKKRESRAREKAKRSTESVNNSDDIVDCQCRSTPVAVSVAVSEAVERVQPVKETGNPPPIGRGTGEPRSEPQNPNLAPLVGGDSPSLFPELGPGPEHKTKKTKASPKPKGWDPTPQQLRLGKLFGRRPITAWSSKELRAFREIEARAKDEAAKEGKKWEEVLNGEVDLIETVYQARRNEKPNYLRKSLEVLLNNWQGELDRATGYIEKSENQTRQGPNI